MTGVFCNKKKPQSSLIRYNLYHSSTVFAWQFKQVLPSHLKCEQVWLGGWAPSEEGVRADPADTVCGASMPLKIGEQHTCAMFVHILIVR